MKCSACQHDNRPGVKFCESCGSSIPEAQVAETRGKFCQNCGHPTSPGSRFCENCGAAIQTTSMAKPQVISVGGIFRFIWKNLFRFAVAFALSYGVFFASTWILKTPVSNLLPFVGLQSARAGSIAQNHVDSYFPEFSQAERSVLAAYVDEEPVYIVDFIRTDVQQGLRVFVARDLGAVWVAELVERN